MDGATVMPPTLGPGINPGAGRTFAAGDRQRGVTTGGRGQGSYADPTEQNRIKNAQHDADERMIVEGIESELSRQQAFLDDPDTSDQEKQEIMAWIIGEQGKLSEAKKDMEDAGLDTRPRPDVPLYSKKKQYKVGDEYRKDGYVWKVTGKGNGPDAGKGGLPGGVRLGCLWRTGV